MVEFVVVGVVIVGGWPGTRSATRSRDGRQTRSQGAACCRAGPPALSRQRRSLRSIRTTNKPACQHAATRQAASPRYPLPPSDGPSAPLHQTEVTVSFVDTPGRHRDCPATADHNQPDPRTIPSRQKNRTRSRSPPLSRTPKSCTSTTMLSTTMSTYRVLATSRPAGSHAAITMAALARARRPAVGVVVPASVADAVPTRRTMATTVTKPKGRLVIIGSGWAGYKLLRQIDTNQFDVFCVSPRNYFVFTPLLAGSSVGTLEFRAIMEPVRQFNKPMQFLQAHCTNIDFDKRQITCTTNLEDSHDTLTLDYDALVIAPGASTNTFNVPGVREHALFLKDISDARKIRARVIECFEHASQPHVTHDEIDRLLHFQTVGGGPTGVEFSAELHDFITEDLARLYPQLMPRVRMTLYDVAPRILGAFDAKLAEYATKRFVRSGVQIRTGTQVRNVEKDKIVLNDGEEVPYGLLVWATGITQTELVRGLRGRVAPDPRGAHRIVTDRRLRVLDPQGEPMENVYALGDCATISDYGLPATAQVANQKALYLGKQLNKTDERTIVPFAYRHLGSMAYVGGWRAVVDMPNDIKPSGYSAWIFWRSSYLSMSVSWRNKCLIPLYWFAAYVFGRDVSRIN
ncbi:hypothetical protein AMAG_01953 [Allomyces macrogynus ATCC 38327]|uniref:NADH:ubiquinone reductase (non-electrogenic) n=1 Tax=Allomyces macrogynus (strain ATCC 38327) TaxID=578462 RepID=A0A0L0S181_ALLM3|nr:hypothetical protein AMAG_01953 [Allomyces macrogynus ATCC 38327]|eukprot:KNE56114.1 hypothetical protein AMAG_01953 [Allomyces macrogynus ATCC 38327]